MNGGWGDTARLMLHLSSMCSGTTREGSRETRGTEGKKADQRRLSKEASKGGWRSGRGTGDDQYTDTLHAKCTFTSMAAARRSRTNTFPPSHPIRIRNTKRLPIGTLATQNGFFLCISVHVLCPAQKGDRQFQRHPPRVGCYAALTRIAQQGEGAPSHRHLLPWRIPPPSRASPTVNVRSGKKEVADVREGGPLRTVRRHTPTVGVSCTRESVHTRITLHTYSHISGREGWDRAGLSPNELDRT